MVFENLYQKSQFLAKRTTLESFHSLVEHSNWYLKSLVEFLRVQQHQIVLLGKPYETKFLFSVLDRSKKLFGFRRGCTYDPNQYYSSSGCNSMVRKSAAKCNCEGDFCNVHQLNNEIFRQILYGGNSRSNG